MDQALLRTEDENVGTNADVAGKNARSTSIV
jgi:hypothetical protein